MNYTDPYANVTSFADQVGYAYTKPTPFEAYGGPDSSMQVRILAFLLYVSMITLDWVIKNFLFIIASI